MGLFVIALEDENDKLSHFWNGDLNTENQGFQANLSNALLFNSRPLARMSLGQLMKDNPDWELKIIKVAQTLKVVE